MQIDFVPSLSTLYPLVFLTACLVVVTGCNNADSKAGSSQSNTPIPSAALDVTVKSIEGQDVALSKYEGQVVLVVNVASRCGYTRQYTDLQKLHETYASQGLSILGFPCNQFGKQEPGTEEEIQQFCSTKYNVQFDMFSKIDVKGESAAPLYRFLTSDRSGLEDNTDVKWNFEKFLIGRDGNVIARYRSKVSPTGPEMTGAIELALAAK